MQVLIALAGLLGVLRADSLSRQYQRGKMIEAYPGGPSVHGRLGCRGRSGIFAECMVSAL